MNIKSYVIVLSAILFVNCSSNSSQTISQEEYQEKLKQTYCLTPDSLMTADQLALKIKVLDFLYSHTTAVNNRQVLSATREQMEAAGIPSVYYDIIMYQLNENNSFVERELKYGTMPQEALDVERMIEDTKEQYWKEERPMLILRLDCLQSVEE